MSVVFNNTHMAGLVACALHLSPAEAALHLIGLYLLLALVFALCIYVLEKLGEAAPARRPQRTSAGRMRFRRSPRRPSPPRPSPRRAPVNTQ